MESLAYTSILQVWIWNVVATLNKSLFLVGNGNQFAVELRRVDYIG